MVNLIIYLELWVNCIFILLPICNIIFWFRFNYRATHYMVTHGFYNFLNWFDDRAWFPLGRIVGGTVCIIYHKKSFILFFNVFK